MLKNPREGLEKDIFDFLQRSYLSELDDGQDIFMNCEVDDYIPVETMVEGIKIAPRKYKMIKEELCHNGLVAFDNIYQIVLERWNRDYDFSSRRLKYNVLMTKLLCKS